MFRVMESDHPLTKYISFDLQINCNPITLNVCYFEVFVSTYTVVSTSQC